LEGINEIKDTKYVSNTMAGVRGAAIYALKIGINTNLNGLVGAFLNT